MFAVKAVVSATLAVAAAGAAGAAEAPITIKGGVRDTVSYTCDDGRAFSVVYVNGSPDALALVPIDGVPRIFVNVISGSGARYASGTFIWWTKGRSASLYDVTRGSDAPPVATCRAAPDNG
ncbi:MAG: MliC family protein [Pararhizobium sp.]